MTNLLQPMLDQLNRAVDAHNVKVSEAVESGEIDERRAAYWRVPPGCVTEDLVRAGPEQWSEPLRRAVHEIIANEAPDEIIRLTDACLVQTETIKHLRLGSKRANRMKDGPLKGLPVGVHLIDMAHLIAHAGASKAILMG